MNWVRVKQASLALLVLASASCTGQPDVTTPSAAALFTPFSGDWVGTAVLTSVTPFVIGDTCVQPSLQNVINTQDQLNVAMTQDGQNLTAHRASATTGLSCSYTGTTSSNRIALDTSSCDYPPLVIRCLNVPPLNTPGVNELTLIGSTIQGTVLNGQFNATITDSYNADNVRVTLSYQFAAAKP